MDKVDNIKKLFGSNTRTKLLGLFLNSPSEPYYVREITRLIDEQINSVRRELTNLEEIGLVQKFERDRKVYYQLGETSDLLKPLRMIFCQLDDQAENSYPGVVGSVDWLEEIAGIKTSLKTLILAGSFLDDDQSEFDMILIGNNNRNKLSRWAQNLETRLGRELHYVIFDQKDFEYRLSAKDKFVTNVFKSKYEVIFDESGKLLKGE